MKIQSSEPKYIPAITMNRTTGELQETKVNWTELMEKARKNQDSFQSGGVYGTTVDPSAPSGLIEVLPSGKEVFHSPIAAAPAAKSAEDEKLDAMLGIKGKGEDFWEARERRQKEFQELRAEEAREQKALQRLRSGEPVSAAELLLG